jgi:hypothetical protein
MAGWIHRRQQLAIAYLQAENRVLRERLGTGRLRFTDAERRLLAEKGQGLGRTMLAEVATAGAIANALEALVHLPGVRLHRWELLWAVLDTLRDVGDAPPTELALALRRRRNLTTHVGRRLARCSAGSTLLMKGMEFDHAVVVHTGGDRGFGMKDLYVALTRGAKSLIIVSVTDILDPKTLPA